MKEQHSDENIIELESVWGLLILREDKRQITFNKNVSVIR